MTFATPVAVTAGTTYVASYLAPNGHYSVTVRGFAAGPIDNPPLHALADLVSPNGVFAYSATLGLPEQQLQRDQLLGGRPVRPRRLSRASRRQDEDRRALAQPDRPAALAALLAACGGQSKPAAAPGSPERPLVAQTPQDALTSGRLNEAAPAAKGTTAEGAKPKADAQPGYQKLVERQGSKPRSRFTPCNLVTKAQARRDRRGAAAGSARGAAGPDVHLPLARTASAS